MKIFKTSLFLAILFFISNSLANNANDNWQGEPFSGFKMTNSVSGNNYMISTADKHASQAGAWALKQGGNAIDAAIASQMVLNLVEPHSSGIGGGGFLLYYDAKSNMTQYFNGRETAPALAHEKMFLNKNGQPKKFLEAVRGGLSVGTPGLLKALKKAHDKYGKLKWAKLFTPAIELAENGFEVDQRLLLLAQQTPFLKKSEESKNLYFSENGQAKKSGSVIKNIELAKTFKIIANEGIKPFYEGKIAKNIVKTVNSSKQNPGYLSLADLKNYKSKTGSLICSTYRIKYKICSMPLPSSGGITILQILGILENFNLANYGANSVEATHIMIEAAKLAYADRNKYVADVKYVPINQMLDKVYLRNRAKLINLNKSIKSAKAGKFEKTIADLNMTINNNKELPSTTHISIIDKQGNAISLTSSIEYYFGSGLITNGFMLNNQLTDFSFRPKIDGKIVANRVQPKKQPRSSMSPAFVFDENDNLIMIVGSPGGPRIIQFVVKTIVNHLDFKMDIQSAISAPNFIVLNDKIELENRTKITKLQTDLEKIGQKIELKDIVSGINAISIKRKKSFFTNKEKTIIEGGADPRRQGKAVGN